MDGSTAVDDSLETVYRCPGDDTLISRGIHLGRLAASYAPCRDCPHRDDIGTFGVRTLDVRPFTPPGAAAHSPGPADLFEDEGLAGILDNQIDSGTIRKLAAAAGIVWRADALQPQTAMLPHVESPVARTGPRVVLGSDGRPLCAELLAAASEGLRGSGCHVVEVEAATAPALAMAVYELEAVGGMLLGNPHGTSHGVGVRMWGHGAVPCSAGGRLDAIRQTFLNGAPRPTRTSGGLERHSTLKPYLARLRGLFHALRSLRIVLDTVSAPLADSLRQLTHATAIQILATAPRGAAFAGSGSPGFDVSKSRPHDSSGAAGQTEQQRRVEWLAQQVPAAQADFGIWIDGTGECCTIVDERGRIVAADRLLAALARIELAGHSGAAVVLECETSPRWRAAITSAGIRVHEAAPRRESMHAAFAASGAAVGGGPSGRIWVVGPPAAADALAVLGWLLALLSRGDRSLSEVLDAALGSG